MYLHTPRGAQIVLRQNARTTLVAGDNVGVDVELGHLHWFDAGRQADRRRPLIPSSFAERPP